MTELDTGYSVKEDHNNNGDYEAHSTAYGLNQRVIEASENADVQEEMQNRVDGFNQRDTTLQRIFLITNFVVELPSAVFDQLSSVHKPQYALISMIMSFIILLISVIDLARMGGRKRVKWMRRGLVPWFYSPYPSYKPLGSFVDIVGLVCGILQCAFATIAYAFLSKHADNPIKISVWPLIFAFGVLYSRFPRNNPRAISVLERVEIHPNSPAQDTLQGLHPSETPLLFNNKNHHEEEVLSEMAVEAKRRAERAKLRELHTFKGQVESLVRRKGLDIDTILQRQYSF